MMRTCLLAFLAMTTTACSATLKSSPLTAAEDASSEPTGVRYFGTAQYEIGVYMLEERGGTWVFVPIADRQVKTLADVSALHQVGYEGAAFASHEFKVELNPNGTLKSVNLAGKGDNGAVTALTAASSVATKAVSFEQDQLKRQLDEVAARLDLATKQRALEELLKGDAKSE